VKYEEWDQIRGELDFSQEEEMEITRTAARMVENHALTQKIARSIADVDATNWGTDDIPDTHPLWQVYVAYGDAVVKMLHAEADSQ